MGINRAPFNALVDDDGTGQVGSVWNKAQIQGVLLDPIDALVSGGWTTFACTLTSDVGGWSSSSPWLRYKTLDKTVLCHYAIENATITGAPTVLQFSLPFPAYGSLLNTHISWIYHPGVAVPLYFGYGEIPLSGSVMQIKRQDLAAFVAGTGFYTRGQFIYERQ